MFVFSEFQRKFSRRWFLAWIGDEDDSSTELDEALATDWERESVAVESVWDTIRSWVLRGLTGGLVSSLAIAGSQAFTASIKSSVFYVICWFLGGIGLLLIRQFLVIIYFHERRLGRTQALSSGGGGFQPAPVWLIAARCFDILALLALCYAILRGLLILHELTQPIA